MASITKRAIILIVCRVMNYAVLLLSPILLVRILDMHSYGQYREFVMYASLLAGIVGFSVNTNFLYFLAKYPEREKRIVTNSTLMSLVASIVGTIAIFALGDSIRARSSYDFVTELILYLFFFVNLDFFEYFWLGKKRSDYVLYYSLVRIAARTFAVIASAYLTRDVPTVLHSMIAVEIAKCVFMLAVFKNSLTGSFDGALAREQLRYFVPLGSSSVIALANSLLGNFVISLKMGVEKLALYSIGSHQLPVINIVRTSVMDVLFPEMAQRDESARLDLWRRANVLFCALIFPVYVLCFYFAGTLIRVLFTSEYLQAVSLFRVYLSIMLLQCFEMGTPLRAVNKNFYFILGSALSLAVNIGFILVFFSRLGFLTPGFAYILSELSAAIYLGAMILALYKLNLDRLFLWGKIARIVISCTVVIPILFAEKLLRMNAVVEALILASLYVISYLVVIRCMHIEEIELLLNKIRGKLHL